MLQEKMMVNDALSSMKSSLTVYTTAISECQNTELRSAFQQIRSGDEASQFELFKIAQSKGFYKPAQMANDTQIQQVRSELQG